MKSYQLTTKAYRKDKTDKLWSKVNKIPEGCWLWQGAVDAGKHGVYWFDVTGDDYKAWTVHRLVYTLLIDKGLIPKKVIDQTCGNSTCCNPQHLQIRKKSSPKPKPPSKYLTLEQKEVEFWSLVDKTPGYGPQGECWLWKGIQHGKYGYYGYIRKVLERTHRISYFLTHGVCPKELHVLHSCDIPLCVNPKHLRLGTPANNAEDRVLRKRSKTQHSHDDVEIKKKNIIEDYKTGLYTKTELVKKYNSDSTTVKKWLVKGGVEEDKDSRFKS